MSYTTHCRSYTTIISTLKNLPGLAVVRTSHKATRELNLHGPGGTTTAGVDYTFKSLTDQDPDARDSIPYIASPLRLSCSTDNASPLFFFLSLRVRYLAFSLTHIREYLQQR